MNLDKEFIVDSLSRFKLETTQQIQELEKEVTDLINLLSDLQAERDLARLFSQSPGLPRNKDALESDNLEGQFSDILERYEQSQKNWLIKLRTLNLKLDEIQYLINCYKS